MTKQQVFGAVMEALQGAEEISGPDGQDYVDLMTEVADEVIRRRAVYQAMNPGATRAELAVLI